MIYNQYDADYLCQMQKKLTVERHGRKYNTP